MTYDQHTASDPHNSVWVSASAGTGKTKVLTDRVLRLLLRGVKPDKILCITYTKAASAEIESRIESQLGKWALAPDDFLTKKLHDLTGATPDSKLLDRARQLFASVLDASQRLRIQTIHGFCQSVLMRFPLEAGIAPNFTLIEERDAQELLRNARTQLFHDTTCADAVAALATIISEGTLSDLLEDIVSNRRKFAVWLERPPEALHAAIYKILDVESVVSEKELLRHYFSYLPEEEEKLKKACEILLQAEGVTDAAMGNAIAIWLQKREDYAAYIDAFTTLAGEPRKRVCTQHAEKLWPVIKDLLLTEQRRVLEFLHKLRAWKVAGASMHIATLARALLTLYREQKALRGALDYDDLIAITSRLLHRGNVASWVLYKLDGGIDHILLDEAQDTSPEQWRIIETLVDEFFAGESARRAERTLFVVGDEKQSIYSFQGAKPAQFDDMQRKLSQRIEAGQAAFKRVRLALSFRSTSAVLQAVDTVFAAADARDGLVFTEQVITHEVSRAGMAGRVEIWPLAKTEELQTNTVWHIPQKHHHAPSPQQLCANQIADTIAYWLKEKRVLASSGRAVTPGDILILVQRRGGFTQWMLRALKRKNIRVAGADRMILTEHIGVMDCIALADFLLLPQDDLTLAIVLKSPFIGMSEEALFFLAYGRGEQSLWQRLKENPAHASAHQILSDLLAKTDYLAPFELFSIALETQGGRKKMIERLGEEVEDPLNEFLSLALQYGQMHTPSLQGFVRWLRAEKTEIKRDMEKSRDEVRIMTVHAAKGLEAPIVFMADTTRLPLGAQSNRPLWTQDDESIPLWSPFANYDDDYYRALRGVYKIEAEREHRRLLYVAMTRARDELYICGWQGAKPVSDRCWYTLISRSATIGNGWSECEDKKILIHEQTAPVEPSSTSIPLKKIEHVPGWAMQKVHDEAAQKRISPSSQLQKEKFLLHKDSRARERGILIHKLLQYLPDVLENEREAATAHFIARYNSALSEGEREGIKKEILAVLSSDDFVPVFSKDSMAEVAISGVIKDTDGNSVIISGQIDRLALQGNDVYIIDYKTGRDVPANESEVPIGYVRQMASYRQLVQQIYPDKTIHCALLWTSVPTLMRL